MIPKLDPADLPNRSRAVILYHSPCADGSAALVAAVRWLQPKHALHAIGVSYGSPSRPRPIPTAEILALKPSAVYIVDFSYSPAEINKFCEVAGGEVTVFILDHHKSAIEDWRAVKCDDHMSSGVLNIDSYRMGNARTPVRFIYPTAGNADRLAGCGVVWEFMAPDGLPMPPAMQLVNDRDLWKLSPDAINLHAFIQTYRNGDDQFENLEQLLLSDDLGGLQLCLRSGQALVDARQKIISDIIGSSLKFGRMLGSLEHQGQKVPVVWRFALVDCTGSLASDAAEACRNRCREANEPIDFVCLWHTTSEGSVTVSLRSSDDSLCDVSQIARQLGGGGHRNASGCSGLSMARFMDTFWCLERDFSDLPQRAAESMMVVPNWVHYECWFNQLVAAGSEPPQLHCLETQRRYLRELSSQQVLQGLQPKSS